MALSTTPPRRRSARRALLLAAIPIVAAGLGCVTGDATPGSAVPTKAGWGEPCAVDSDCEWASGAELLCGVDPDGNPVCVDACGDTYGDSVENGVVTAEACMGGRQTPCNYLPAATTCGCGCAAAGTYCAVSADGGSGACVPAFQPGAPCQGNAMCSSGLCCSGGTCGVSGTCSASLGSACTATTDCPACFFASASGQPLWCSMACSVITSVAGVLTSNCPYGFACLGPTGAQTGFCYEECNSYAGGLPGTDGCPAGSACKPYAKAPGDFDSSGYACQ